MRNSDSLALSKKCILVFIRLPEIIPFYVEADTGGVLQEKVFLEISQNLQENTCARVSF